MSIKFNKIVGGNIMLQVTLQGIKEAKETIKDIVKKTDMLECASLSNKTKANVFYKCENLQRTGSFKVRGACNKIANLTDKEKANGVIASSAGNHAQGVALGAKMSGIKSTIVMPATAPLLKVSATKGYGAEVVLNGLVYDDAYAKAVEIQKETGATFLHPFNDKHVIAGQGTIGLEIFEQLNDKVDTILCPIGGGGLIAGVAVAAKALNPNVKVIGVQTANIPSMHESMKNGQVSSAFKSTTIADGIAVKTPGDMTFEIIKELVDEVVLVEEEEIAQGIVYLMENLKVVAEGSGAVTTAALLSGKYAPKENENVVCIISGGNVDVNNLYRIIGSGLAKEGRRYSFSVTMIDKPGGFSELTKIISENNANILNANQSRLSSGAYIGKQNAEFVLETFDNEHIQKIKSDIEAAGFEIKDL
jgi:threonine dehydratase